MPAAEHSNVSDPRTARLDDLAALLALESLFPGDRLSRRQMRRHLASPNALLRVAEGEDGLAGYSLTLLHSGTAAARLYSIVVAPRFRGRGIARRLLDDALAQSARHGRTELRLEVREDNAAAIGLYREAGFQVFGRRADYYEDGAAGLRMRKATAAAAAA